MKRIISFVLSLGIIISLFGGIDMSVFATTTESENSKTELIDIDIYRAQCFAGIAYDPDTDAVEDCNAIYNYYIDEGIYSPTKSFLDAVYSDEELMAEFALWQLESLGVDSSSIVDTPVQKKDYYESLITAIIAQEFAEGSKGTQDLAVQATGYYATIVDSLCNITDSADTLELVDKLDVNSPDTMSVLEQMFDEHPELGGFDVIDIILSASNTIMDAIEKIAAYSTMHSLDQETKDWLESMYNACDQNTDAALKTALFNLMNASFSFTHAVLVDIKDTSFRLANWGIGATVNVGLSMLAATNPLTTTIMAGLKLGKTICDICFATSDICEQFFLLECMYDIQSLARTVTEDAKSRFNNSQTSGNAKAFTYATHYYFESIINTDIDCMISFLDLLYNGGLLKGALTWMYGATDDYQEAVDTLESLREVRQNNYNLMINLYKAALAINYKDTYDYYYTVDNTVPITGISFRESWLLPMKAGDFSNIYVQYEPSNTTQKAYSVTSDNPAVVEVHDNIITAIAEGTANITIRSVENPQISYTRQITVGAESEDVHNGAKEYNGHWYKLITEEMNWIEAEEYCRDIGGHLVTITSEGENSFVQSLISESTMIGLSDASEEGVWTWVTGEDVIYTNWARREPNNQANEDYVLMQAGGTWNDGHLQREDRGFVCEWESVTDIEIPGPEDPTEPSESIEPEFSLKTGDQVVIYNPTYNKALSSKKTGFYNEGVDVTLDGGILTGYDNTEIWGVGINPDGTYTFAQNGQNIGMAASYSYMDLGTEYDAWEVTDLGDGLCNIKNVGRGNYMEWYDHYSNWSTYRTSHATTDSLFQLSFYIVEEDAGTIEPIEPTEEPTEPELTIVDSGTCGDNLTWILDNAGILTISGTGMMDNYTSWDSIPWHDYVQVINGVVINDGIVTISDYAFTACVNLINIDISESVTTISDNVFADCTSLMSVTIPDSVTSIGAGTFYNCSSLTDVTISESITSIAGWAFAGCRSLTSVTIPNRVTSIDLYAFDNCTSLTDVYYGGTQEQWNAITIDEGNEYLTSATIHFKVAVEYQYVANGEEITVSYDTLEDALASVTGGTVKLLTDVTVDTVFLKPGVTLDLNGYTLTAEMLIAMNGAMVTDGGEDCVGGGLLKVVKENLALAKDNGGIIPVWNGTDGYVFTKVTFQQLASTAGESAAQYIFLPTFSNADAAALLADGGADNAIKIKVGLTWSDGQCQQFYTYSDELVQKVFDGTGRWVFDLKITGIAGITDMVANAIVVTDSGAQVTNTDTAIKAG